MSAPGPGHSNLERGYYLAAEDGGLLSTYYTGSDVDIPLPQPVTIKNKDGSEEQIAGSARKGKQSLFNRYSIFYYNSIEGHGLNPEPYMDSPDRLADLKANGVGGFQDVINNPTASNIIKWSSQGGSQKGTNAIEYAFEDFLWCKNYGAIPNNYMVTLRKFPIPVTDDLLDSLKQPTPDIARLITWVDGESNKWENVGLKFSSSVNWKKLESEIQSVEAKPGWGNEGGALGGAFGNVVKQFSSLTQPGHGEAMRAYNPNTAGIDPYANKNVVFGPIDVIKEMMVRDKGINFSQEMNVKFEYEIRSIDGINPKVAMIDLLSNVLVLTANRGQFWGGEIRYYGGNPRRVKPLGDPEKLVKGDVAGYFDSLVKSVGERLNGLSGGAGLTLAGVGNAIKNIGGGIMDNIIGGGLDKMGRPGANALNALLTGEDTGEYHLMVGNPANPIISIGNLILEKAEIDLHGPLGADDFPTKLTVTCTLKPGRPRDRSDIISMFHRNGRTYVTDPPSSGKFAGNKVKGGQNGGKVPTNDKGYNWDAELKKDKNLAKRAAESGRFPNHSSGGTPTGPDAFILDNTAQGIF